MPPETCPDCDGSGLDPSSNNSNKDQEYGNPLLDFTFKIWENQNPFEV